LVVNVFFLQAKDAFLQSKGVVPKRNFIRKFEIAGLSMGMSFLWESYGKRPMGWDSTHLYFP